MTSPRLHVLGMGAAHPNNIIDNKFLEELQVGTNAQWIIEKIGISTRRTSLPIDYIRETRNQDPLQALSVATCTATDLGVQAAQVALKRAGIEASQVGLVITNCCTPLATMPCEAERIAARLGIRCLAYEVFTACPAFALHLHYLRSFAHDTLPEYVLCVSTATLTHKVNYNDRSDGAIWGDGAAAWVVSPRHEGRLRIVTTSIATDATRAHAVVVDRFGFFHQDGRAVRDFSVRQTVRLIKALEMEHGLDWNRDIFVGHQANRTMLDQITNNRGIPPQSHWHNVATIGNQAGAGAPAVLAQHWDDIRPGRRVVVAVVGAGLSWGSVLFEAVT